jgi:hypothetical protein
VRTSTSGKLPASLEKPVVNSTTNDETQPKQHTLPGSQETLLHAIQARHLPMVQKLSDDLQPSLPAVAEDQLRLLKIQWLDPQAWATIYAEPEATLGLSSAKADDADVWYLTWESFRSYADRGYVFNRPIVIKQQFQDSGMYDIVDYIHRLWYRFPLQHIDVQDSRSGKCSKKTMEEFMLAVSLADLSSAVDVVPFSNALSLGKLARADEPLFTRLDRFCLLSVLVDRLNGIVGKKQVKEPSDVEGSLGFNLLGFTGAFSRPHLDYLVGTWVRCLVGRKIWSIVPRMDENDWEGFARESCNWSPGGKARILVLEKDDVLLMPPGLRAVHAVFTPEPSLMEGGMLWDVDNLPEILQGLLWIGRNQACTNEAIAYQLPAIIDALEQWVLHYPAANLSTEEEDGKYWQDVRTGIAQLRELGCVCKQGCQRAKACPCRVEGRRCTAWCRNHPRLPGQKFDDEFVEAEDEERPGRIGSQTSPTARRARLRSQTTFECMHDV